jgi:adenylate cyclase
LGAGDSPGSRSSATSQALKCSGCGMEIQQSFRFCPGCGQTIEPPSVVVGDGLERSRRRRAVTLFADLVGFSTLAEYMDPEHLQSLLAGVFDDLARQIEDGGGHVERFIGDSVLATFGSRRAHDDDPRRAVDTAFGMLQAVRSHSLHSPAPIQLRIGINSGLVVSGALGSQSDIFGDSVNVAARLQQTAAPGEVLVSGAVWRRVRDHYDGEHVGALDVKGREQRVDTYRVLRPHDTVSRKQAPFVGRRDELALLELLWSNSVKGNSHVVSLVGEPGVGKSRLLTEFPVRTDGRDIRVACSSIRAFGPFIEVIYQLLGAIPNDLEELKDICAGIEGTDDELAVLLAALLGLSGPPAVVATSHDHQKRQVFAAVWLFILAAAAQRPLLLILDDIHWADRSSVELIGFLLERVGGAPFMMVLSHRPGFENIERTAVRASHTGIRLEQLTPQESVTLARGFLGVTKMPPDLERLVASRAEGNPFFIEELLQALLELGSLAVRDGAAVLARVEIEIPDTVEGTIMARVDRLSAKAQSVLQHASVIGRSFSPALLRAITGEPDLDPLLDELGRAQLIVAQASDRWGFKHALIQEVTYDALLLRQRSELHRVVAEALEERGDASLELLAEHYTKAKIQDKARRYALAAGDAAVERMGYIEARDRYETALSLWGQGDEEGRLSVLMKLAYAELLSADQAAATTALIEAEAGWRTLGNMRRAGEALATRGRVLFWTGEAGRSDDAYRQAIELLDSEGPSPELAKALMWASALKVTSGAMDEAAALAARGLALDPAILSDGARASLLTTRSAARVYMGNLEDVTAIRAALELAERSGDTEARARAYVNLVLCLSELSDEGALSMAQRGRQAMSRVGAAWYEETLAGKEAWILGQLGRHSEAAEACRGVVQARRAVRVVPGYLFSGFALAQIAIRRGRLQEARATLDDVLPHARRIGGGMFLLPALTLEAELEEVRGNPASARLSAGEALELALKTPSVLHAFFALVPVARILADDVGPLLDRLAAVGPHPYLDARRTEARGILGADSALFAAAADVYASLELPCEEARCRLDAGELDRATELIDRFGLQKGPLGARLAERDTS